MAVFERKKNISRNNLKQKTVDCVKKTKTKTKTQTEIKEDHKDQYKIPHCLDKIYSKTVLKIKCSEINTAVG